MRKSLITAAAAITLAVTASAASAATVQVGAVSEVRVSFGKDVQNKPRVYGQREKDQLTKDLSREVEKAVGGFTPNGGVLEVTIQDVKANRPTWTQMSYTPGLSYIDSFGVGGATLEGVYIAPNGDRTPVEYSWYESDITNAKFLSEWHDTGRTFQRFAKRLAAKN